MNCSFAVSILFLLIVGKIENVYGYASYNWIPHVSGDPLPVNAVLIMNSDDRYIGRARHFDEILPAEISVNGTAFISSCHKIIPKEQFEILTVSNSSCEWKSFSNIGDINESVVRAGTAWNGEPIYIGVSFQRYSDNDKFRVGSIYLTRNELYTWFFRESNYYTEKWQYLSCNSNTKWIDSSVAKLPNNTISGGKSEEDYEIYVAQLKRGCSIVTGQAIPELGTATAYLNDGLPIEAAYCEVLVGEPNEYTWVAATDGEIPDFAVVNGKHGNELQYVARVNKTIGHLKHSEALREQMDYDILVTKPL